MSDAATLDVLIADDEPLARARLAALLAECEGVHVVASLGDAEAALAACVESKPDVLLLDIRMPGLDGLQLARRLSAMAPAPQVVFCTAFEGHAVDAYDVRAADYLLKPVGIERLRRALDRARSLAAANGRAAASYLHAHVRGESVRVALDDVLYLVADEKYVSAHTTQGTVLLEDSLKSLERDFPERLLRLHRNCLVPRERLLGIRALDDGRGMARIAGSDRTLEVSRRNLPTLRKLLREG
jgi:two-component system response regulator AlgR